MVIIYTDGSALNNKKDAPAGWACLFVFIDGKTILRSGSQYSTNNAAEIQAISYALWYSVNKLNLNEENVTIKSDSEYAINVITGKKNAKVNVKAISVCKKLIQQLESMNCSIEFEHVMAHTGGSDDDSKYNDIVDKEARRQASTLSKSKASETSNNIGTPSILKKTGSRTVMIVWISKKLTNYKWFSDHYTSDGYDVIEYEEGMLQKYSERIHESKWLSICVCNADEYEKIRDKIDFRNYILITHPGFKFSQPQHHPTLEILKGGFETWKKFGSFARNCLCCRCENIDDAYEWFYNSQYHVVNYDNMDTTTGGLMRYMESQFRIKESFCLNKALGMYGMRHKLLFKSTDISTIAYGIFNITYDISKLDPETIIRIHVNDQLEFDALSCKILSKERDTGFISVKEYDDKNKWCTMPMCTEIKSVHKDMDKCKEMLIKVRHFLVKHPELVFVDYHWGNIMQYKDQYVIIDIDLNMLSIEWLLQREKPLSAYLNKFISINWSCGEISVPVLRHLKIPITYTTVSLCVLEMFELANYGGKLELTQEVINEIGDRLHKTLDGVDLITKYRHVNEDRIDAFDYFHP